MTDKLAIIHGCFNTTNFGDLLLLEMASAHLMCTWQVRCETLRLSKSVTLEHCSPLSTAVNAIRPDYAIFGGGGYLDDNHGHPIDTKRLIRYYYPARIWSVLKIPYAVIGPGGGPVAVGKGAERIKWICRNASHIALRDEVSIAFVRSLGIDRPDLVESADMALSLRPQDIPAKHTFGYIRDFRAINPTRKVIGIHLEKIYADNERFAEFCQLPFLQNQRFLDQFHLLFFYDFQSENQEYVEKCLSKIKGLSYSIHGRMNHWMTADLLGQCDAVLTTKLHVSIVASALGVPVFGFSFHEKTARFFDQIGRSGFQVMWNSPMSAINHWMILLRDGNQEAWTLSEKRMASIKRLSAKNFDVLDKYMLHRKCTPV